MSTRRVVATSVVVVLLLFVASVVWMRRASGGIAVRADDPRLDGFRLETSTQEDPGQASIQLTVGICWTGLATVRTSSAGGADVLVAFEVLDAEGDVVADTTHRLHTMELRSVLWLPGQCRTAKQDWDQHYWNRPGADEPDMLGTPARGDLVEPGNYRFRVTWVSAHWDDIPRAVETATTSDFPVVNGR